MIKKELQIINKLGLHARAAAKLVQTASRYASLIELTRNGKTVNGKSIMGVMMLAASQHSFIEVRIEGEDEVDAFNAIEKLIANRFGEER
ncbi:HPr family phosphocarrier protein [Candidatus Berkiella aquae]|uniref:HPr family phosphocarrier protein n=1 Tax=Candidatus Berkiella aquae TaxID=295108 RepID=A0A0Q9YVM1_9GAMM|nr:HPr family phosphocarrier protein [Candidatus Berkiella aquae]MCS5710722.1 HPr family phosphocarrier protein [Candidatus Berkiella aquae]